MPCQGLVRQACTLVGGKATQDADLVHEPTAADVQRRRGDRADDIEAIVLTHGHEDHVGALPYLMREVDIPEVWATRLTLGLVKSKLDEHGLMRRRIASINDLPITEEARKYRWPLGRRPGGGDVLPREAPAGLQGSLSVTEAPGVRTEDRGGARFTVVVVALSSHGRETAPFSAGNRGGEESGLSEHRSERDHPAKALPWGTRRRATEEAKATEDRPSLVMVRSAVRLRQTNRKAS